MPEPRTDDSESSLLPTPSAVTYGSNQGGAAGRTGKVRPSLQTMAAKDMWPTPRASANENRQTRVTPSQEAGTHGRSLAAEVNARTWPPTRAPESKGTGPLGSKSNNHRVVKGYLDATVQQQEQATGKLNPEWVGWLMGFPLGFLDGIGNTSSESSATPSSRKSRKQSVKQS